MTTTDHEMWAHGAAASVTPAALTAQPPIYNYPPDEPGPGPDGPRHKLPRWLPAAAVVTIAAAGFGGWLLRGTQADTAPAAAPPTATVDPLTPDQAKQQTCGAYKTLGMQWSMAYQKWTKALPQPWTWDDPAVTAATSEFDTTATQVASQMTQLTEPGTPADVTSAVREVRLKIVDLAASHGQITTSADAKLDAVDQAMTMANQVCGFRQR
ncbi:hypothetical protein EB73_06630 [Mycobacterium sp. SWH-M3]|nr:hypothetical protein EB73_06630 [Mycobacterium sp. SWH-M3]